LLGIWEKVLGDLVAKKRVRQGRSEDLSLLIVGAQSIHTAGKGEQSGFDGGKKIQGRKRQIAVDTQGNLHQVLVHKANIHDSKGGAVLADIMLRQRNGVKTFLADWGSRGLFAEVVTQLHKRKVGFSTKITGKFVLQPKRWIVERTIAWLNWACRLSKDFEQKCIYSENIIRISAIALILQQIH